MTGNVIVGQSGGPTSVINASLVGVYKSAKDLGAKKIYGMRNGIFGLLDERYVDLGEYIKNDLDIELLKRTPSSFLGSCRYRLPEFNVDSSPYEKIFKLLTDLDILYFFYIGGNDSMDTVSKLSRYGKSINSPIRFVGIPKTIDNDLANTDHTPGFGSAAKYIASTMKEVIRDNMVYGTDSIAIVEIMGRNAGWLTASAALSKSQDCSGPEILCLPEVPFSPDEFIELVNERHKTKKAFVIAVSEGVKTIDGDYVCELHKRSNIKDAFGHTALGGTATYLADFVTEKLGIKTRGFSLGPLQRCASHIVSRTDISEAYQAGAFGMQEAFAGKSGIVIVFNRVSTEPYFIQMSAADVTEIANVEKKIPKNWITGDKTYVTEECISYMKPLIIGELQPFMVAGMPMHLYLD